jgi:DNA-binding MarR family transcriptional regulator
MLKELSSGLGLKNSAITGLVSRMEKAGLINRVSCSADGRSYRISLTEKARVIGRKGIPLTVQLNERMARGYTTEEVNLIIRFFDSLIKLSKEQNYE